MNAISFEQWTQWYQSGQYNTVPYLYSVSLSAGEERVSDWQAAWEAASPYAIVLESGKSGRYSYLGLRPHSVIRGASRARRQEGGEQWAEIIDLAGGGLPESRQGEPLALVREWMGDRRGPRLDGGLPKWTGGCAGFWSYDIVRSIERLPQQADDDLEVPEFLFMQLDELWIVDHVEQRLYCAVHCRVEAGMAADELQAAYHAAGNAAGQMAELYRAIAADLGAADQAAARRKKVSSSASEVAVDRVQGITSRFSKQRFEDAVRRIQAYIAAGDAFQVNLSIRHSREVQSGAEELYEWLRLINPSPYMGMLRAPDFQIVSASPELLVESRGGKLATRPIAGTRRRGRDAEEDRRLEAELLADEKERAEHVMLVDLERNDLGRIAVYGSVKVEEFMAVEYYSHVMHLVSQVEGRLAPGKDAYDVIAATFPGGTITGAPKVRTMEIIEELEPTRRGPYTGSMGWIDYSGDMEFNIIIRTMVLQGGVAHIQAGAGIVIDSDPGREYVESLNKAKALWKAVQFSEGLLAAEAESLAEGIGGRQP